MGKSSTYNEQPLLASRHRPVSLGRYALRRPVNASALGTTWIAYDPESGRDVAVTLMPTPGRERCARDRLADRARRWQRVDHPNVAKISEVGVYLDPRDTDRRNEGVFVVRESVGGLRLRRWLDTQPPGAGSTDVIIDTFCKVGEAIAAAHRVGVVHGDGGLDSVLVGADGRVRVVGFDAGTSEHTEPLDARSDQFVFCVALQVALQSRGVRPGRRLRAALERGTAVRPTERFASMTELVAELAASRSWLRVLCDALTKKVPRAPGTPATAATFRS